MMDPLRLTMIPPWTCKKTSSAITRDIPTRFPLEYDETKPTSEQDVLLPVESAPRQKRSTKKAKDDFDMFADDNDDMFAEDPVQMAILKPIQ